MSNKQKTKQRLSVQEFQTWLQGIMEFQSSDWSPNAEQWAAIFEKIMNLKTEETVATVNVSATSLKKIETMLGDSLRNFNVAPMTLRERQINNARSAPQSPGLFDEVESGPNHNGPLSQNGLSPGQELISAEEFQQLSKEELEAKLKAAKEGLGTVGTGIQPQHKTPNIDTTKGYKSNFL